MKISRQDLLTTLKLLEPGLAVKPIVEELLFYWFDGKRVFAYNDIVGISSPLETEITGGMKGSLLLGILDKSRAKEVEFTNSENSGELLVRAANARLALAHFELERAVWEVPVIDKSKAFPLTKQFLIGIENVLVSVGQDTSTPEQLGVTVVPSIGDYVDLYTTDSKTISRARVKVQKEFKLADRVILPAVFCEQLTKICKHGGVMVITDNSVLAENEEGVQLFSRLIHSVRPLDFVSTIDAALTALEGQDLVPIPDRFKLAIERVSIVLEGHMGEPALFTVKEGALRMFAQTSLGKINDSMKLDADHKGIDVWVDPSLIKRALDGREDFYLCESCTVLSGPDFIHLISTSDR